MAQPFDYISPFQQADGADSTLRAMQMGTQAGVLEQQRALFEAQRTAAEQKALRDQQEADAAAERQRQINDKISVLMAKDPASRTFADYESVAVLLPQKEADSLRANWKELGSDRQANMLDFGGRVLAAFQSKSPEIGIQMLRERAVAERNAGREDQAKGYETWASMAEIDPDSVSVSIGTLIAQVPGGDKVIEGISKLEETRQKKLEAPFKLRAATADAIIKEAEATFAPEKFGAELGLTQAQIEAAKAARRASDAAARKSGAEATRAEAESRQISAGIIPADKRPEAESKFRKEYSDQTKGYQDVKSAYGRVLASEPTAAGDIALIFNYMKMLDPISAVREGEFATAEKAGSVPDRIWNLYNRIVSGERLTPTQRKMFSKQAEGLYRQAQTGESQVRDGISRIARGYGLNTENIFYTSEEVAPVAPVMPQTAGAPSAGAPATGARGAPPMPAGFRVIR